jgi:hypothetical protein
MSEEIKKAEAKKAESYFRKKTTERIPPEDLDKKITGGPSKPIKKIIEKQDKVRIMTETFFIIYEKGSLSARKIMKILNEKEIKFSGEILFEVLKELKEKKFIEGTFGGSPGKLSAPLIEYFSITDKGKEFVQEEAKKAEATKK